MKTAEPTNMLNICFIGTELTFFFTLNRLVYFPYSQEHDCKNANGRDFQCDGSCSGNPIVTKS